MATKRGGKGHEGPASFWTLRPTYIRDQNNGRIQEVGCRHLPARDFWHETLSPKTCQSNPCWVRENLSSRPSPFLSGQDLCRTLAFFSTSTATLKMMKLSPQPAIHAIDVSGLLVLAKCHVLGPPVSNASCTNQAGQLLEIGNIPTPLTSTSEEWQWAIQPCSN